MLEKNERVGNKKAGGVKHVRIAFAGGDKQDRLIGLQFLAAAFNRRSFAGCGPIVFAFEHDDAFEIE
jgi:hypothetical protein